MSRWIVDIHGDIEGDYDLVRKYEEPNKWIPISKETPKKEGEYLTTTMYNEVYCDFWNGDRFIRSETVIAWMPKPKPYKVESEDENG